MLRESFNSFDRFLKVCKDFIGPMTVENVLTNISLLAEIVDTVLVSRYQKS